MFGHAWLTYPKDSKDSKEKKWAAQARLKMKIDLWNEGDLNQLRYSTGSKVKHPEVKFPIDPLLYLGYGPIEYDNQTKGIRLKTPPAIKENSTAIWSLYLRDSFEENVFDEIKNTLRLIHLFGTIGGRSRNGWGALVLESVNGEKFFDLSSILDVKNGHSRKWLYNYAREWRIALKLDWCHAVGKDDEGLLFWRSKDDFPTWQEAMRHLAEVKIALRTQFHFRGAGPHSNLCDRQILAYPVTKHSLKEWGSQGRLANQLFFKVHRVGERYVPIIVHLPHGIPEVLKERLSAKDKSGLSKREEEVWLKVHKVLDENKDLRMQRLS